MEFLRACKARVSRLFNASTLFHSDAHHFQHLSRSIGKPSQAAAAVAGIARCISTDLDTLAVKLLKKHQHMQLSLVEPLLEVLQTSSSSQEGCKTACLQDSFAAVETREVAATAAHLLYRIACTSEGKECLGQHLDLLLHLCTDSSNVACPQAAMYLGSTLTAVLNCEASKQQLKQQHLQLLLQAALEPPGELISANCFCSSCRSSSRSNSSSTASLQDERYDSRSSSNTSRSSSGSHSTAFSVLTVLAQQHQVLGQLLQQLPQLLEQANTNKCAAGGVLDLLQTLLQLAGTGTQPVLLQHAGAVAQCVQKLYQLAHQMQQQQQQTRQLQAQQATVHGSQQQDILYQSATSAKPDEVSVIDVEERVQDAASVLVNLLSLHEVRQHLIQQHHKQQQQQQQQQQQGPADAAAAALTAQHEEQALESAVYCLLQTTRYFQLRQSDGRALFASAADVLGLIGATPEGAAMLSAPQRLQQLLDVVRVELQQTVQYSPWWRSRCEFFLELVQTQVSYGAKHGFVPAFLPKLLADWLQQHLLTAQHQKAQQAPAQHDTPDIAEHLHGAPLEQQLQVFLDQTLQAAKQQLPQQQQQQERQDVESDSDLRCQASSKELQSLLEGFVFDIEDIEGSGVEYEAAADPTLDGQQQQQLSAAAVTARLALLIECMAPLATCKQGLMMLVPYTSLLQATAAVLQQLGHDCASSSAAADMDNRHPVMPDDIDVAAAAAVCAAAKARQMAAAALAAVQQVRFEYSITCDDLRDATLSMVRCYLEYTTAAQSHAWSKKEQQCNSAYKAGQQLSQQQQQEEEEEQEEINGRLRCSFEALNASIEDLAVAVGAAMSVEQLLQLTQPQEASSDH